MHKYHDLSIPYRVLRYTDPLDVTRCSMGRDSLKVNLKKPRFKKPEPDPDLNDCVDFHECVFENHRDLFDRVLKEVDFERATVKVWGEDHPEPRGTSLHGLDPAFSYTYSNKARAVKPMSPVLIEIGNKLRELFGVEYNMVLVNYYKDGDDRIGLHSDSEQGIDKTDICSVSLGAERRFR